MEGFENVTKDALLAAGLDKWLARVAAEKAVRASAKIVEAARRKTADIRERFEPLEVSAHAVFTAQIARLREPLTEAEREQSGAEALHAANLAALEAAEKADAEYRPAE